MERFSSRLTVTLGVAVLELCGEIDVSGQDRLEATIAKAVDEAGRAVIIDLRGIRFMDSTALCCLVQGSRRAREQHVRFHLRDVSSCAQRVLDITDLSGMLAATPSPVA